MRSQNIFQVFIAYIFLVMAGNSSSLFSSDKPLTVAESSDFTATSTHSEVVRFIKQIQRMSPYLRTEKICTTLEGREVPLLVLGKPLPSGPAELKNDKRLVVYIQANIHAGEVEGKEASLMLVRDILLNEKLPYLDDLVILIAPNFNPDGNDRINTDNRRRQHGPSKGVGIRYNAQNLDLNRDGIKLESVEVQGMVKNVLNRWDPALFVDCHTTNGSYHQEPVTYTWAFNPNGDNGMIDYMHDTFMPFLQKNLKEKYDIMSVVFGDFIDSANPEKGWETAGPQGRYLTNYMGLRNRLAILNENYAYAEYKDRVWGCYYFLQSVFEHCSRDKKKIQKMIQKADERMVAHGYDPKTSDSFIVEYDQQAFDELVTIQGWEMKVTPREGRWPLVEKLEAKKTYTIPYFCKYVPKRSIDFPAGYFITVLEPDVLEKLKQHGIQIERLIDSLKVTVEGFKPSDIKSRERPYQGHHINTMQGEYFQEEKTFPKGTIFVSTAQRLGTVVAYLLEPECDDGLFAWNFFDRYLYPQWGRELKILPIYRLKKPVKIKKEIIP